MTKNVYTTARAWIELDRAALECNIAFLRSRLPEGCRLMPAVKAEGYGHGAVLMAKELVRLGVDAFCVACVPEGIELRQAGVPGEILVLGYTPPEEFPLLRRYGLTQTVTDFPYAEALNQYGEMLHVHIGIDTGMHRLGLNWKDTDAVRKVYEMEHLMVDGIFTHLPASDSFSPEHRAFTENQIRHFYQLINKLGSFGFPCPGRHILASYGIMNLLSKDADAASENVSPGQPHGNHVPELSAASLPSRSFLVSEAESLKSDHIPDRLLAADYVRPGIALYGILSTEADTKTWQSRLRPILSLKARVASVRMLRAGESAGYGLAFTADKDMQIATVCIGYADGLPRALSHGKGSVLIGGHRAPIIGRICMDQTLVDISAIPQVQAGDVAVVIGKSGNLEITVGELAEECDTITNEILSRLGHRLERFFV